MRILDYIPTGHKNAISRTLLTNEMAKRGISERNMRLMIAEVNQKGESDELIINLQDGKGYFRPAKDEDNLVRIWQKLHNSRVSECRENVDAANRYLNRNKKEPKKEDWLAEHQMSLFDGMVG